MTALPPEPDPANTPDLEPGGGVSPGSTPPDAGQTSGLSAPEPAAVKHFPVSGVIALIAVVILVIVFAAVAVALVL
ncbi:DUF6480 family protein [Rhodococcus qingshengii]|uniref:DUF6480 family protein n=1 Tax=Rhodococcus qingshengii TaxID=334542 RepID=UPI001BEBFBA6|nr:DUF6480 family protein [Rhodococcus qingshengii]MBT2274436.1 hypothetical protein [Rhodococcus qingshengii]